MNRLTTFIYWTSSLSVWCFASLYLAAMLVAPSAGLQVTGMLELEKGSDISIFYGWLYTAALIATALSALAFWRFHFFRYPTMVLAGIVLGLTALPVGNSIFHDFRPGFYENYIGEGLTILALILLTVVAALTGSQKKAWVQE